MEWQPENKINKRLFRLIDPEQPLHSDDIFLPSVDYSVIDLLWVGLWFCIFTTGIIALSYGLIDEFMFDIHEKESKGLPSAISILLVLGFCFGAFKTWSSLHSKLIRREMLKNGRFRNGMFILKNAILLHHMSQIFYVEKKYICDLHIITKGRGDPPKLLMIIQKNDEERINVRIDNLNLKYSVYTLKKSIIHWVNTGIWEIQTAVSEFSMPKINTP